MTKAKKPSVIIVNGSPKRLKIGFKIRFKTPKTIAKIIAVENPSKWTPGKTLVNRKATTAVISRRIIKFMILILILCYLRNKCHSKSMKTPMNYKHTGN